MASEVLKTTASTPSFQPTEVRKGIDAFKLPGPVNWTAVKIIPDQPPKPGDEPIDPVSAKYADTYFAYFHHRCPIIHRPASEAEHENTLVASSVKMIGAWLLDSSESKSLAIMFFCQSALLNIIFALYYGNESSISGAIMLKSILITALREVEFFKKETAWHDEKPGFFEPMRLIRLGDRQRLATYLFKIDAYLSMFRDQPAVVLSEELHYSLPSTFRLYNADGLHIWEERQAKEPIYRSQTSTRKMIARSSFDLVTEDEKPMLIEDIQTCICAMQPNIWKICAASGYYQHDTTIISKNNLKAQLDSLKNKLIEISNQLPDEDALKREKSMPYLFYFGYEDPSMIRIFPFSFPFKIPGWQYHVVARVKSLLFDSIMLYHLSSLQIFAELRKFTNLARDRQLGAIEKASTVHRQAREQRIVEMRAWGTTPTARWCLCHAVEILVAHQAIILDDRTSGLTLKTLDPIAHIALCAAALVVWVYCILDVQGCEHCTPGIGTFIELKLSYSPDVHFEQEKEVWIDSGNGYRVKLQGIPICSCNVDILMAMFQEWLPDSWATADSMAPGIFKFST
ncbi:uncharacterized protein RSE6_14543 [Rhynchosporium secalis]|uniref:Transcription factor domain-containing protein n=1 Tax=Rhynchosporium secalis TaxID=38038 RepID=A0A1E1MVJ7_RHYSE|nr:uncharacterized protein RSE6_14543 [Rhynchosporium secalis]